MTSKTQLNESITHCPKCGSANIYRWFCGEYTCQDCSELFGECEEPKRFRERKEMIPI